MERSNQQLSLAVECLPRRIERVQMRRSSATALMLVAASCGFVRADDSSPPKRRFEFPSLSLRLELPDGWSAFEVDFSVVHYRDVFLCINSIGADSLRVEGSLRELPLRPPLPRSLGPYNAEVVADQLPPGCVYIDIGFFEGPASGPHFSGARRDDYESSASSFSASGSRVMWKTERLTSYELSFLKWGHSWSVFVHFREPVSTLDRQAAFDLLKNLTFIDQPVTSAMRAEAAAFAYLPVSVRDSVMSKEAECRECCVWGVYPRCEMRDSSFVVTLELEKRRWKYLVSRDGHVAPMEGAER